MNVPGAVIAVCGVGDGAQMAVVSRLLATELTRRAAPGAVLLTAARGADATGLERARGRRAIVLADAGPLDDAAAAALRLAAAVICTFRADIEPRQLATTLASEPARAAGAARWLAVPTTVGGALRRPCAPSRLGSR